MTIKTQSPKAARLLAASALLATVATPAFLRAADPYDAKLEKRVEALERELNLMSGDSKGKNAQTYEVPTFLRAAGKQVQELTIQGDLRFRYQWDNDDLQVPPTTDQTTQQGRARFRLRLTLNYQFPDRWDAGVGVQTAASADSGHQTLTEAWLKGEFIYFGAWNLEKNLHTLDGNRATSALLGSSGRLTFADQNASRVLQVQLTTNF